MCCCLYSAKCYELSFVHCSVQAGTWYQVPNKPGDADFRETSPYVQDLVRMSVLAHRAERGNIIWTCWRPGGAGARIGDVRRVNSGAMLLMMTPRGAAEIALALVHPGDQARKNMMRPHHFDIALKNWLSRPHTSRAVQACYVFPPVGNYSTHPSGCDPQWSKGAGRPSCWDEAWCCPGTTVGQDPQRREKLFLAWDGDKGHTEIASAVVDLPAAGPILWLSYWEGKMARPTFVEPGLRRPQKATGEEEAGGAGVEPSAAPDIPGVKKKPAGKGQRLPTTEDIRKSKGKGKRKEPPFSVWPQEAGVDALLRGDPRDPIEQFADDEFDPDASAPRLTKRQRRTLRSALLMRSFRHWVNTREQALQFYS